MRDSDLPNDSFWALCYSAVSLRSKFYAGLFMRTADRDLAEKAALLGRFNEQV